MTDQPTIWREGNRIRATVGVSIVCADPANCPEVHVGGMGGTPVHLPPDGVVVPGHFDHGVPSDVEAAS